MNHYINYGKRKDLFLTSEGMECYFESGPVLCPRRSSTLRQRSDGPWITPSDHPRIEELARPGMEVVLLFDDLQRPTPVHLALPEIMDRLNRAGIPDERITGICAVGTHPIPTPEQLQKEGRDRSPSPASRAASSPTIPMLRTM